MLINCNNSFTVTFSDKQQKSWIRTYHHVTLRKLNVQQHIKCSFVGLLARIMYTADVNIMTLSRVLVFRSIHVRMNSYTVEHSNFISSAPTHLS